MSVRTIIEINHDLGSAIEDDPLDFVGTLKMLLNDADNKAAQEYLRRRYGVRVVVSVHHSDSRKVVVGDKEYPL